MSRTRVKICGITRAQDALAAAQAGADAIGMVFYRSAKRCITLETARQVLAALPPFVTPVGLFVNSPPSEIQQIASALELRHLQLHGDEDIECIRRLEEARRVRLVARASRLHDLPSRTPVGPPLDTGRNSNKSIRQERGMR